MKPNREVIWIAITVSSTFNLTLVQSALQCLTAIHVNQKLEITVLKGCKHTKSKLQQKR